MLPIRNLDVEEDGHTFTFEVVSSQDAKPEEGKKAKRGEKEIFYFSAEKDMKDYLKEMLKLSEDIACCHEEGRNESGSILCPLLIRMLKSMPCISALVTLHALPTL